MTAIVIGCVQGCASKPKVPSKPPTTRVFRVTHHLGGTHYRTIVHNGVWYQTFGSSLLIVDPQEATVLKEIEFGKAGEIGPAIDMLIHERDGQPRMHIVIEDEQVIELSLDVPQTPSIINQWSSEKLGVRPKRLSLVDQELYVSGPGGVVRLSDLARLLSIEQDAGRVARSRDGLVASVGRQVRRLQDNRYVGSASDLQMLPDEYENSEALVFVLQSGQGALVGLMSPELREMESPQAKVAAHGQVRSVRLIDGKLWIVTDEAVFAYAVSNGRLQQSLQVQVVGALDADQLDQNYLAIAGSFGRSIYRIANDAKGPGNTFVRGHREPSGLQQAITDGQHILAGGPAGLWMYLINSRVELTSRTFDRPPPPPPTQAATVAAQAQIAPDQKSLIISSTSADAPPNDWTHAEPDNSTIHCVVAVDGDFWIGHEKGITVLEASGPSPPLGRLRLAGPVLYIYPLQVGGGASFVSESAGFGVAQFVDEPLSVSR